MAELPVAGRSKTARRAEHFRLATLFGKSLARGQPYPEVCLSAASRRFERQGLRRSGSSFARDRFFGCRYGCCQRTASVPRNRRPKWAGASRSLSDVLVCRNESAFIGKCVVRPSGGTGQRSPAWRRSGLAFFRRLDRKSTRLNRRGKRSL